VNAPAASSVLKVDRGTAAPNTSNGGWVVLLGLVAIVFAIGKCSSSSNDAGGSATSTVASNAQQAIASAVQAQSPTPLLPLSRLAAFRGAGRVSLTSREGLAGEMIYSQNCYDALGRAFSWAKLDECGAFDAEAVLSLGDDVSQGESTEEAWFQSETAAGRFLKAATAAGEDADDADARWSELQALVGKKHKAPLPTPPSSVTPPQSEPDRVPSNEEELQNVEV
jgi:hypothetical protein